MTASLTTGSTSRRRKRFGFRERKDEAGCGRWLFSREKEENTMLEREGVKQAVGGGCFGIYDISSETTCGPHRKLSWFVGVGQKE